MTQDVNSTRIKINGVWYVQEDTVNTTTEHFDEIDPTQSQTYVYETDEYCWEAVRLYKTDDMFYPEIFIEFTDKTIPRDKRTDTEIWDNMTWLRGVYDNNPESLLTAKQVMSKEGIKAFRTFINFLIQKEWITKS